MPTTGGGGGFPAKELPGRDPAGEDPFESPEEARAGFFQGVADPLFATIPGNTETGLADASAVTD